MRLVLIGDGDSPHLLKWARALAAVPGLELWALSSRGFMPGFETLLPSAQRLALNTRPAAAGGNLGLLRTLPQVVRWLRTVRPDWLHAHYLTSHGTLAWLAQKAGVPGRLAGSAWGSDILVTPQRGATWRWLTRRVLAACTLCSSDSQVMAARMRDLGAGEVMVFPFGLEALPEPQPKDALLVFANRGLEPIYRPERVLQVFAAMRVWQPALRLVVANDGSLRSTLPALARGLGLEDGAVQFVGRLDAQAQAGWYGRAQWYLSLPQSDSVSVSVLEAMAHGCLPLLSDLPANHELVRDGDNGLILADGVSPAATTLDGLQQRAEAVATANRAWVRQHALFAPAVQDFVERLRALQ